MWWKNTAIEDVDDHCNYILWPCGRNNKLLSDEHIALSEAFHSGGFTLGPRAKAPNVSQAAKISADMNLRADHILMGIVRTLGPGPQIFGARTAPAFRSKGARCSAFFQLRLLVHRTTFTDSKGNNMCTVRIEITPKLFKGAELDEESLYICWIRYIFTVSNVSVTAFDLFAQQSIEGSLDCNSTKKSHAGTWVCWSWWTEA